MPTPPYLGAFELMVMLALMRLDDDAYGVTIAKEIEARTGRDIALGSVYVTLERLETKAYVGSALGSPTAERGGRAKRFFRPTAEGVRAVRDAHRMFRALAKNIPALNGSTA